MSDKSGANHSTSAIVTNSIKRCHVCGDQAFAFNYNGLTCESCKSFFRRNAFNYEEFTCKHNETCEIVLANRRFCQKCRLKKCFEVGMKKELLKWKPDFDTTNTANGNNNSLISQSNYEVHCLESIRKITTIFAEKPICNLQILGYAYDLGYLFQKRENYLDRLTKFSSCIEGFSSLGQKDQAALIGNSFGEVVMLRSAFYFNFEKDSLIIRLDHQCNECVYVRLERFYGSEPNCLIGLHRSMAYLIRDLIGDDELLLELIIVLLMFRSSTETSCPELIKYYHTKYCHLMELYLQQKLDFSPDRARDKSEKILQFIDRESGPLRWSVGQVAAQMKAKHQDSGQTNQGLKKYINSLGT